MVRRASVTRQRYLRDFGTHIRRWRKLRGMSTVELARRAAITRETLRRIENGTGDVRLDSMFAVLEILGILDATVEGASPFNNDAARARIDDILLAGGKI